MFRQFHLKDIILLAIIGIVFGVIYLATGFIYNGLTVLLTPFGYGPMANDITLGIWCMAGPLAAFMLRLPGASFLGEFLSAFVEMLLGDQWGVTTLLSGLVQGIGTELGFSLTLYKMYNWLTLVLSATTTTIATFAWDWFRNGYNHFGASMLLVMFIVRWISMFFFTGVLVKLIINLLNRSHVLSR
jgi:energy-coupling factor transport system substrate-specific component